MSEDEQPRPYQPQQQRPTGYVVRSQSRDISGKVTDTLIVHPYGHRFPDLNRQAWVGKMGAYEKLIGLPNLEAGHIPQKKMEMTRLAFAVCVSLDNLAVKNPAVLPFADEFFMREVYGPLATYMGLEGNMVKSEHVETHVEKVVRPSRSFFRRGKED